MPLTVEALILMRESLAIECIVSMLCLGLRMDSRESCGTSGAIVSPVGACPNASLRCTLPIREWVMGWTADTVLGPLNVISGTGTKSELEPSISYNNMIVSEGPNVSQRCVTNRVAISRHKSVCKKMYLNVSLYVSLCISMCRYLCPHMYRCVGICHVSACVAICHMCRYV